MPSLWTLKYCVLLCHFAVIYSIPNKRNFWLSATFPEQLRGCTFKWWWLGIHIYITCRPCIPLRATGGCFQVMEKLCPNVRERQRERCKWEIVYTFQYFDVFIEKSDDDFYWKWSWNCWIILLFSCALQNCRHHFLEIVQLCDEKCKQVSRINQK